MKGNIKTQAITPSEAQKAAVNKYIISLDNPRITSAEVIRKVDNNDHITEILLHGRRLEIFAKAKTKNMYRSLKEAVNKVKRQLRKRTTL